MQELEDSICNDDPIGEIRDRIGEVGVRDRRQTHFWGSNANSPMHAAAAMGRADAIKELSSAGFEVNVVLFAGTPPSVNNDVEFTWPLAIAMGCRHD